MDNFLEIEIRNLQTFLREIATKDSRIPMLVPDGKFESETQNAVKVFQELNSLQVTGEVDEQTLAEIYKQYKQILKEKEVVKIDIFDSDKNKFYLAQVLLKEIGESFYNFSQVEITGIKDEKTAVLFEEIKEISELKNDASDKEIFREISRIFNSVSDR